MNDGLFEQWDQKSEWTRPKFVRDEKLMTCMWSVISQLKNVTHAKWGVVWLIWMIFLKCAQFNWWRAYMSDIFFNHDMQMGNCICWKINRPYILLLHIPEAKSGKKQVRFVNNFQKEEKIEVLLYVSAF